MAPFVMLAQQTIVLRDGTSFNGRLTSATQNSVMFRDSAGVNHRFDVNNINSLQFNTGYGASTQYPNGQYSGQYPNGQSNNGYQSGPASNNQYANGGGYAGNSGDYQNRGYGRQGNRMMLAAGTEVAVRTNESIESANSNDNRFYSAVVSRDVTDDRGNIVIPRGSDAQLVVRRLDNNTVALDLQSVVVNGQRFNVDTEQVTEQGNSRQGVGENRRTAEYAGGGAVLGTLLGAIAGGGKGAAIGALAGGAAGVGAQVLTRGGQVRVPAETELSFRLDRPMSLHY
jgi:hypothetical protein